MENPLLSIIVPVYQVEKYLPACIESVLAQTFTDFELILIDDGSTDRSGSICDCYARKDNRIRVVHQENRGLSGARNAGIRIASGKYLAFIDSDDTISSDLFEKNMAILVANGEIDLLEFPIFIYYGAPEQKLWRKGPGRYSDNIFSEWLKMGGHTHCYACNKIYKRTLFNRINFPERKIFEDIYTIPLIMKDVQSYYLSDKGLYYYHAHAGSISRTQGFEQYHALFDSYYFLWKMVRSEKMLQIENLISLNMADWLISMARCDRKRTKQLDREYDYPKISFPDLIRSDIPLTRKLKNIPFVLFGMKSQYRLFALIKQAKNHNSTEVK